MPKSLHITFDLYADLTNVADAHMPDKLSGSSEQRLTMNIPNNKFKNTCIEII
jgi:hypothetical protein